MADFTQNITNSVRCFGPGPSTKWGQANGYPYTMTWGTSLWGEDGVMATQFQKVIANSQALDWAHAEVVDFVRTISVGTATTDFSSTSQNLKNGDWFYVFTSDTTGGEGRVFASWTAASTTDATFTCQAAGSTTWSEA